MDKLRAPDKFNLDARNLADAWKKWKEELNLYIDLTMDDDNEPAKVKLFLYLTLIVYFCFSPATDESLFCQMAISATSDTMVECRAELIIKAA
jgi:hypothetical protein